MAPNPDECYYVTRTGTYTTEISLPSDGLVTQQSASALPGVNPTECIIKADGVNHEELKNHVEMTRILDDIFSGKKKDPRNPYFFDLTK